MIFGPLHLPPPPAILAADEMACPAAARATVDMEFINNLPVQRTDLSGRDLGNFNISTTFSHSNAETFMVGGLTVSEVAPQYLVSFSGLMDPATGRQCVSVDSVRIKVEYSPTIYIASEYRPDTCWFRQTLLHEARHVNTDIIVFNEMLPRLKAAVERAAAEIGMVGPVGPDAVNAARDRIIDTLKAALAKKTGELERERFDRQQAIDTRQEYLRIQHLCEGEPQPLR